MCTHRYARTHARTHARSFVRSLARSHARTHARAHTHAQPHTPVRDARVRARARAQTRTHTHAESFEAALNKPRTKLVWIETPANPTWAVTNIAAVAGVCPPPDVLSPREREGGREKHSCSYVRDWQREREGGREKHSCEMYICWLWPSSVSRH